MHRSDFDREDLGILGEEFDANVAALNAAIPALDGMFEKFVVKTDDSIAFVDSEGDDLSGVTGPEITTFQVALGDLNAKARECREEGATIKYYSNPEEPLRVRYEYSRTVRG